MTTTKEVEKSIKEVKIMTAKYKFNDEEIKALSCLMATSKALLSI